ncbi:MAG: exonuclease [Synechococcaceae cyanobacterium SM2_3_2]|nr:exonuclease [Synechococcaceae cyanobacterium SM2_3_2]
MRVAQNLLRNNRLLFIRQPTHPDNIYHHIYSRTLESLIEPVDGTHTQLDYLIAKSFVEILKTRQLTPKAAELLTLLDADPLNLFHRLGSEGTTRRRSYWQAIEIQVIRWWSDRHFFTGASENILKGIIKYCSYSDRHRRDIIIRWLSGTEVDPESAAKVNLPLWSEQLTPNSFALQGMTILGHLSLLDNPLIIVFDQLEALGLPSNQDILLNFGETLKELFTHVPNSLFILNLFPDRWQHFQTTFDGSITDRIGQHQIQLHPPSEAQLKILLQQRFAPAATCRIPATPIEALFPADDLQDMLSQPSIRKAINRAADYYRFHINGIPLPLQIQERTPTPDDWQTRIQRLETDLTQVKAALQTLLPDLKLSPSSPTKSPAQRPEDSDTPPPQILTPDPIAALLDPYLQASEAAQNISYAKATIITDEDDIGKLRRICEALKTLYPLDMTVLSYRKRVLPQHLFLPNTKRVIGFLQSTGNSFTSRLKNFNELVLSYPNLTFLLLRDPRQTPITTKVATQEVEKLNNRPNGSFQPLTQPDRIHMEVLAQLILDIQNQDLELDLTQALKYYLKRRDPSFITWILSHAQALQTS